jgi:hypothetical protein
MPKYHDDSATGWASHGRNDLPHIRFNSVGIEADNSSSISMLGEALHPPKGATTHCNDKIRQRLSAMSPGQCSG